jgi:type IV pilus assembly protein PilW
MSAKSNGRTFFVPHERGFTLIEVMVAVALAGIVAAAAFTILTTTSKAVGANEQVVNTQQDVRLAMELLSRDVKMAGFGNPGVAIGNCTYPIMPADNRPTGVDTGPDSVQLLVPTTKSTGTTPWQLQTATSPNGATQIVLKPGAVTDMVASGLANGSYISINGSHTAQVTAVNAATDRITVLVPAPVWFPASVPVYLLQCIRYQVVTNAAVCGTGEPCLTRGVAGVTAGPNAEAPIVEGIEDLQLAYACDGCVATINGGNPDRVIDNQGGSAGFDQSDFVSDNLWATPPLTPDKIKLVQISLVASQPKADSGFGETLQAKIGSGGLTVSPDRTLGANPAHRRRMLTKTIDVRNVGL